MFAHGRLAAFLIGTLGFHQVAALGGPPTNALNNPGFEAVQGDRVAGWSTPEYWSGSVAPVADESAARSGERFARLTSVEKQSRHWGRVLQSVRPRDITGRRFRYSMWARGSGEFLLGCIEYRSPERHKPHYKYRWQATPVDLGGEWQEVVFEFAVPDPEVRGLAVVAEVRGAGSEVLLDDAAFIRSQEPGVCLVATPSYAMAPIGRRLDFQIKVEKNGEPHNLFGKPEELEKFNAVAKRIAAELGADYVDVYEPTRTHPNKQSLFNPADGVHLTNTGNLFIAHELLEYLGRK